MDDEAQPIIYGLDFTSAPSRAKPLTLAHCILDGQLLHVLEINKLPTFSAFEQVLAAPGLWVMGIDFPFGLPRKLLEDLGWPTKWSAYVAHVKGMDKEAYEETLRSYRRRPKRCTDHVSKSQSPANLVNPPVGKMFFRGAPLLLRSGATVIPCHSGDSGRIVLEAYPKLVAEAIVGRHSYKSDDRNKQTDAQKQVREHILRGLANAATYNLNVEITGTVAASAVNDPTGDVLDAVLCAVQASWSWEKRQNGYGVPQDCDTTEGWIVDPANA